VVTVALPELPVTAAVLGEAVALGDACVAVADDSDELLVEPVVATLEVFALLVPVLSAVVAVWPA
jgi:hypothetical protein